MKRYRDMLRKQGKRVYDHVSGDKKEVVSPVETPKELVGLKPKESMIINKESMIINFDRNITQSDRDNITQRMKSYLNKIKSKRKAKVFMGRMNITDVGTPEYSGKKHDGTHIISAKHTPHVKGVNKFGVVGDVLKYLIREYGGVISIVKSVYGGLSSFNVVKDNKIVSAVIKSASVGMVWYDMYNKIHLYINSVTPCPDDYKSQYLSEILNTDDYIERYHPSSYNLTPEIASWSLDANSSDLGDIRILAYYDLHKGLKLKSMTECESESVCVLYEYDNKKFLVEMQSAITKASVISTNFITLKRIYSATYSDMVTLFVNKLRIKYIESLGYDKNVFTYNGYHITTRPRTLGVDIDIDTLKFPELISNITTILTTGKRRGLLLVGPPGSGKTTILKKIESELSEFPIIYATARNLDNEEAINRLSELIKTIGKCIVCIEDMDSLELQDKTHNVAPLLTLFDNSVNHASVVFIATINYSKLVNPSIVRTGRFDTVLEISQPKTKASVYKVLKYHWKLIGGNMECFPDIDDISWITYMRMIRKKLTQSDYCELVQKIQLWEEIVDNKSVIKAYKEIMKSKKIFKAYKHPSEDI